MAKPPPSSSYRSQKATIASLSLFEKLDTIGVLFTVVSKAFIALITGVTRARERRPESYFKYVVLTAIRVFGERATTGQEQYIAPPTDDAYSIFCKRRHIKPHSEILEDGTLAHWIGDPKAEKLILNFHGGGYVLPCPPEMFEFMSQVISNLQSSGKSNVSCLMLSYDLAPRAQYPRQLQQAARLLQHVLYNLKVPPSNIIVSGDSAGGNLAISLLSHLSHPHPSTSVPIPKIELAEPLLGIALISPWLSFETEAPSFKNNEFKDCVSISSGKKWSGAFLGCPWPHEEAVDEYNQPAMAEESWWKGIQVKRVLILAGEEEVLVDGIREFEKKFREVVENEGIKVDGYFVKGEYHDQPNIDLQMGYGNKDGKGEGQMAKAVKKWYVDTF